MPVCPQCGKSFSGFSFGSNPATECKDCRKAKARAAALNATASEGSGSASGATSARVKFTPTVTAALVGLNVLVYLAMGLSGVSWTEPSIEHAVRWGADFGPLTLSGEWWRVLTSTFVHFGIIHIAFNMWCLWSLGSSLELFMGRKAFAVTYVLSGLAASLTSIAWDPWRVSAGASGAIFGIAGAFVSYLYFQKAPLDKVQVRQKLKNLAIFIGYNLLFGARGNVDNSAHVGGLVAGLILGALAPAILRRVDAAVPSVDALGPAAVTVPVAPIVLAEIAPDQMSRVEQRTLQIAVVGLVVLIAAAGWVRSANLPAAGYGKAVTLVSAGHLDQGIAEMDRVVTVDPNIFIASALLGEWRLEQGNPAAAVPALEHSNALFPNVYYVRHNLALAYVGTGRPVDALTQIAGALLNEKTDPWRGQYIEALAGAQSGNKLLALKDLRSVLSAKPDFQEARDALAGLESASPPAPAAMIPYAKVASKSAAWPLYP
jgi:membrane associated rhomboid family serine protease